MSSINQIAGIVLAGGSSNRFGTPKQMVNWHGKFLINHIIDIILGGGIDNLHVVLGFHHIEIREVIKNKKIKIINNIQWESGMSSSIKAGIEALDKNTLGAFLFLVDQPFLHEDLIRRMIYAFENEDADIIAPRVNGQQCNPVLFRSKLFGDLLSIQGDRGGKMLFNKNSTHWIDWDDERLLLDIDTIEDYLLAEKI